MAWKRTRNARLFLAVGVLNVFGLALSLCVNHVLINNYHNLVSDNANLEITRNQIAHLQRLANNADLPGNDIFQSKDLPRERARLDQIVHEFEASLNEFKKSPHATSVLDKTDPIALNFLSMKDEADAVFSYFEKDLLKAQSHMALMDQKNAALNEDFSKIRQKLSEQQSYLLETHQNTSDTLTHWSYLIAALSITVVSLVCYQGMLTLRKMHRQGAEQENLISEVNKKNIELQKSFKLFTSLDQILNRYSLISKTDLSGNIIYANENFSRVSGYSRDELIGQNHRILKSQEHPSEFYKNIWDTILSGRVWHGEIKNRKRNGEFYWADSTIGPIFDENGKTVEYMSVRFDITEKKLNEQELFQAQKLESIGKLSAGIAHDFNNLLGGILGYASTLKEKFKEDPKTYSRLEIIEKSALRGAELTKQLLGFARKGKYEKKVININDIAEDTRKLLQSSIHKNIQITTKLLPNINLIAGDSSQLSQVFLNMCINASDALPQGGKIVIETSNITLTDTSKFKDLKPGAYICISISDTGTGIPHEILDKIFDPFFTTKPVGKGSGLGLAMVHGIIKNHEGAIEVKSELGSGTVFHIYLPVTDQKEMILSESIVKPRHLNLNGKNILLVDDEDTMRGVACEILETSQANIIEAKNGQEALEIFEKYKGKLAVILMDVMMPVMDGICAYHTLRKIDPNIPVVLISGYAENEEISELRKSSKAYFMQKPYQKNNLIEIIDSILHQGSTH